MTVRRFGRQWCQQSRKETQGSYYIIACLAKSLTPWDDQLRRLAYKNACAALSIRRPNMLIMVHVRKHSSALSQISSLSRNAVPNVSGQRKPRCHTRCRVTQKRKDGLLSLPLPQLPSPLSARLGARSFVGLVRVPRLPAVMRIITTCRSQALMRRQGGPR